jgi:hypothetical protein
MVHFALEPAAAREAIALARKCGSSVWVGSDTLTPDEFQALVAEGVKVTRFSHPLSGASSETVDRAISIIEEHHPDEVVWIQHIDRF